MDQNFASHFLSRPMLTALAGDRLDPELWGHESRMQVSGVLTSSRLFVFLFFVFFGFLFSVFSIFVLFLSVCFKGPWAVASLSITSLLRD
jgi:hypothetical protein